MQLYYQTDVSFIMAFLLMLISVIAHFRLNAKDKTSRTYLITAWIIVFILLIEAYTIIIDGKSDQLSVFLAITLNTVLFGVGPILTLSWFYLIRSLFAPGVKQHKMMDILLIIPLAINMLIVILNPWTHWIFSIENGFYVRNDWFPIVTTTTYMYVLFSLIIVVENRKLIMKQDKILLLVSITLPIFGGIIQGLNYGILTIWPSVACALILMYLFLQQRVIHLDYLTKAWTRETFFSYIRRLEKMSPIPQSYVLYFDLNELKAINDTYGHTAGDHALKIIVELVKKALPNKTLIARLGGDEFIAMIVTNTLLDLGEYVSNIQQLIDDYNRTNQVPYLIGISIGYGNFKESYTQFDKFMNQLDTLMYEDKQKN